MKNFSLAARAKSFTHAGRGIWIFITSTHNAWIHVVATVLCVVLGFYFHLSRLEWIALVFAFALVFISEAFNTAIEIDIDLTSPEYHPFARATKDVAAGAVLISALAAVVVGFLVFMPHIL